MNYVYETMASFITATSIPSPETIINLRGKKTKMRNSNSPCCVPDHIPTPSSSRQKYPLHFVLIETTRAVFIPTVPAIIVYIKKPTQSASIQI